VSLKSKRKGEAGERELRAELRQHLGEICERTGYQQAHRGGWDLTLPNLGVEVKRHARIRDGDVRAFWEQVCEQMSDHGVVGVLAYREDHQRWRFVVPALVHDGKHLAVRPDLDYAQTYFTPGFCDWYRVVVQPEPEELRLKVH
jgi:hypothetical protein